MNRETSIVIPVRKGDNPETTLKSLARQTYKDFDVVVALQDESTQSVSYTRNRGFERTSNSKFILFSDADIEWSPDALQRLRDQLVINEDASWAYGAYEMAGRIQCAREFNALLLLQCNYISTMSLIRREHFLGFAEDIYRLNDWELWVRMVKKGFKASYVGGGTIFTTKPKDGITQNGSVTWEEAYMKVKLRHSL